MTESTLLEHLINDFQEQKQTLKTQIELVDPLAASIRQPVASRVLNRGLLIFLEIIAWLFVLAAVGFVFFMDQLFPFHYLSQLSFDQRVIDVYPQQDLVYLTWTVKGMSVFIGLLFFWIARMLRRIRLKNDILHRSAKSMKTLVEQLFRRRSQMEQLENKFPLALPTDVDSIVTKPRENPDNHNDILL